MRSATRHAALLLAVAGCARAEADARPGHGAAPPTEVTVRATDFAFVAPDTVPAGLARLRLVNGGREMHHAQLARLAPGRTVRELLDSAAHGPLPKWVTFVGGPNTPPTGGASEALVALTPGDYALLCFITSADRTPHLAKGMVRPLTVVPSGRPAAPLPRAEVRMVLDDYSFVVDPVLRPGRRTIRVENRAAQPHEVVIGRLAPGKTSADLLAWLKARNGPPPAEAVGGTVMLSPGEANVVTLDLPAGDYVLLCFAPDAKDGKSHVAHGMVRQVRVG